MAISRASSVSPARNDRHEDSQQDIRREESSHADAAGVDFIEINTPTLKTPLCR